MPTWPLKFTALDFSDADGVPLPSNRPAQVISVEYLYADKPVRKWRFRGFGVSGNIEDILATVRKPQPDLGVGLSKDWSRLHPLLKSAPREIS